MANLDANGQAMKVMGTAENDALTYTPTGTSAGTFQNAGLNTVFNFTGVTGTFTLTRPGADTVTVNGTSVGDTVSVVRGATTTVQENAPATFKAISLTANTEALVVAAGLGDDVINVSGSGGPALDVDGGLPTASDTLNVTTGANAIVSVTFGTDPSTGVVDDNVSGNVSFQGIEILGLTGSGAATGLTVNGTNGDDAINQNGNSVTVNNGAVVNFSGYPTLTLSGRQRR